jgi:hypothetical protein
MRRGALTVTFQTTVGRPGRTTGRAVVIRLAVGRNAERGGDVSDSITTV